MACLEAADRHRVHWSAEHWGEAYYLCTVYLLGIRLALLPPRHLSEYSLWDKEIAGPPHHREMIPLSVC